MEVRWAALLPDVGLTQGKGHASGLAMLLKEATAIMFVVPGLPPVYAAGVASVKWTTDREWPSHQLVQRFWGIEPAEGCRLWLWPDGTMVGIGESVESALKAREALREASR